MRNRDHGRSWLSAIAIVGLLGLVWGGCATRTELPTAPSSSQSLEKGGAPLLSQSKSTTSSNDYCELFTAFDFRNFSNPTRIDNLWLPMTPGRRYVLEGLANRGGGLLPHRVVFTVTDVTKEIHGIRCLVVWDEDYNEGTLAEAELAFFAQDTSGTVWRMGEYPEEYEEGKFVAARPWIHGFEDARAGIMMPAKPDLGTPSYAQGWGPAVDWTDRGQVDQMGQKTCVPVTCYEDVLVIAETSQSEPDAQQLKYYARGVGNVRVGWRGAGEKTKETLELVRIEQLDAAALAEARTRALELERSAYQRSKTVYAHTPPAERF